MTTRIKVGIRVKPFLDQELQKGYINNKVQLNETSKEIIISEDQSRQRKAFKFDHVFGIECSQSQVYEDSNIDFLLTKVVEGYHSTIFAYGQTGSGKTHTMEGYEYESVPQKEGKGKTMDGFMPNLSKPRPKQIQDLQRFGIIPRAVRSLFDKLRAKNGGEFNVTCSFLQIYNEKIYDLLNPNSIKQSNIDGTPLLSQGLRMRWNQRDQFQVENLFVFDCKNADEVMNFFHYGIRNRVTASHKLNMASSRSHTILTLRIESIDLSTQSSSFSKLELVDLAGSERIGQTGTEGKLAKESIDINKSLFILRQVITSLSDIHRSAKQKDSQSTQYQHIPYRDSKLTSLLKQSIGGNCYCLMLACINPCDSFLDENLSTLKYASKAAYIKNEPIRNDDPKNKVIKNIKKENYQLKLELDKANQHIAFISQLSNTGGELGPNHPPMCCLPNCQYKRGQLQNITETPSQKSQMSLVQSNQDQIDEQDSYRDLKNKNKNHISPMSMNNLSKIDSSSSTVRDSHTNFSNMNPALFSSAQNGGLNQNPLTQLQYQSFIQQQQLLSRINTLQCQNQQLQNNSIQGVQGKGDYDNFSERLIESITMVRDLLINNKELRETTDQAIKKSEICEKDLFHLQRENQDLRDCIQHLKNGGQLDDFNSATPNLSEGIDEENGNLFTNKPLSPSIIWQNMTKNQLISEILALRRDKKILERLIQGHEIDRSSLINSSLSQQNENPSQNNIKTYNRRVLNSNSPIKSQNTLNNTQQISLSQSKKVNININKNTDLQNNVTSILRDSAPSNLGRYTFYDNIHQFNNIDTSNQSDMPKLNQHRQSSNLDLSANNSPLSIISSHRQTHVLKRPQPLNKSPIQNSNQLIYNEQLDDFITKRQRNKINTNHLLNRSNSNKPNQKQCSRHQNHSYSLSRSQNPNNSSFQF